MIGVEPIHIDFVVPDEWEFRQWYKRWSEICNDLGWHLTYARANMFGKVYEPKGLWIACVPALRRRRKSHAIVMKGAKLHYDPQPFHPRKQRPHKLWGAFYLDPIKNA